MDLRKYLPPEAILLLDRAPDKWDLMASMLDRLVDRVFQRGGERLDRDALWHALRAREQTQSTGLGYGFALPHARVEHVMSLELELAILREGLPFDAVDGKPVHLICMALIPMEQPALALKLHARMAHLATNPGTFKALIEASDAIRANEVLRMQSRELEIVLTARDIMQRPVFSARPDMPITAITHNLMHYRIETAPVLDEAGVLLGEINCDRLLQYGMPDFFNQLKTISFISRFDPFEKYFADEGKVKAGDVMSRDLSTLSESATLLEIVFELTVRKRHCVYILRDKKLVGIIDRSIMLDQVINF